MDLFYKGKPYKHDLSLREVCYELGIPKTTLSRYLKSQPNHKNSYFEQSGETIKQFFFGKLINKFDCIDAMAIEFDISVKRCKRALTKKELWFHKFFSIQENNA